jgi:hypothetical protein
MKFEIECVCNTQNPTPAQISIRWKRIPLGNTEQSKVTLITEAGYPTFDLHQAEFDFKTTFIDVNKSLPCVMTNNGNASCNWKVICENVSISMDIMSGTCKLHQERFFQEKPWSHI